MNENDYKIYMRKNNPSPIKGRKAEVTGFQNPVRVTSYRKQLSFFYKMSKIAFLSAKVNFVPATRRCGTL